MRLPNHLSVGFSLALSACSLHVEPSCDVRGQTSGGEPSVEPPGADAPACPGRARTGTTACFATPCGPGLYCDESTLRECRPGCVSDENCGPRDRCVRGEGAAVGRCEACSDHTPHPAAAHCVAPARTGTSPCFFGDCGPGQFCGGDQRCVPGCVSDENCSGEEQCVREPGVAQGVCRSCYF